MQATTNESPARQSPAITGLAAQRQALLCDLEELRQQKRDLQRLDDAGWRTAVTPEERTSAWWGGVIADLSAKRQAALDRVERLRGEKRALALEAAMGGGEAQKRLVKISAELTNAAFELDALETAGAEAEERRKTAEGVSAAEAERRRRELIGENLRQYLDAARQIDDAMGLLAARFATARQALDRAESLMTGAERTPLQQFRSKWGATCAACAHDLSQFLNFGPEASHVQHHRPLASFVAPYVDVWVQPVDGKA